MFFFIIFSFILYLKLIYISINKNKFKLKNNGMSAINTYIEKDIFKLIKPPNKNLFFYFVYHKI